MVEKMEEQKAEQEKYIPDLITVLIPAYNGEKYIVPFLDSLYRQTYRPLHIVISDDCSTDSTLLKIKQWKEKKETDDFKIKVIKNKRNHGLTGNISIASKYAQGKYVCLADQDDLWMEDKIEKQAAYLNNNGDCFFCLCDRQLFISQFGIVVESEAEYQNSRFIKYDHRQVLRKKIAVAANCLMFRNENLNKLFPIPIKMIEHDRFITVMGTKFGKLGFLPEVLVSYRLHEDNLSGSYCFESSKHVLECLKKLAAKYHRYALKEENDEILIHRELNKRFGEHGKAPLKKNKWTFRKQMLSEIKDAIYKGKLGKFYKV